VPPRRRNLQHFAGSRVGAETNRVSELCDPDPAVRTCPKWCWARIAGRGPEIVDPVVGSGSTVFELFEWVAVSGGE
jgi:hypothetical protein